MISCWRLSALIPNPSIQRVKENNDLKFTPKQSRLKRMHEHEGVTLAATSCVRSVYIYTSMYVIDYLKERGRRRGFMGNGETSSKGSLDNNPAVDIIVLM